ncbi:extracellular cellulase allergen Asp F7-like protein [Rutstroemia sp. NJR-2017a BBW]|nr:extracellular cellulase allergen Asp F7-like protein [Rutstroemia sp. NJR-2017a BBW]
MLFKASTILGFATLSFAAAVAYDDVCESDNTSPAVKPVAASTGASSLAAATSVIQATSLSSSLSTASSTTMLTVAKSSSSPLAVASSSPVTSVSRASVNGDGTWYGEDCGEESCWQNGACAFVDYVLPASIAGSTCVSELIWNSSYNCGGCVEITYQGKKKIAMITNKTGGDAVHLDMSPDMFSQLADKSKGEIDIEWAHVPCPITTPLQIAMHGGSSQYWFAATVENAILRTASMEVSSDSGATWKPTTRNINNFFEFPSAGGTGTKTAWVRVTSETGSQVVVKNVDMTSKTVTKATGNYA